MLIRYRRTVGDRRYSAAPGWFRPSRRRSRPRAAPKDASARRPKRDQRPAFASGPAPCVQLRVDSSAKAARLPGAVVEVSAWHKPRAARARIAKSRRAQRRSSAVLHIPSVASAPARHGVCQLDPARNAESSCQATCSPGRSGVCGRPQRCGLTSSLQPGHRFLPSHPAFLHAARHSSFRARRRCSKVCPITDDD